MPETMYCLAGPPPSGEGRLQLPWRLIALVAIAALGYLAWRGYQQPDLMLEFGNLRFC